MFAAGCIQLLIQVYPLLKLNLLPNFSLDLKHPGVRKVAYLMIPGVIAGGVSQLNMLVDTILASFLPTGSPTWLYVSDRLMQLPLGIFAIAIGTVILPKLSSLHQTKDQKSFSMTMDWALRLVLLVGLPSIVGLVVLSEPIILTLFERGEFLPFDIRSIVCLQSPLAIAESISQPRSLYKFLKILSSSLSIFYL